MSRAPQGQIKAWVWARGAAGFAPGPQVLEGGEAVIHIETLNVDLPLGEIYARVRME